MLSVDIHLLLWSAMFLALGMISPFLTGQIPQLGQMLLPMHIPVVLCGLICGSRWGFWVGLLLPVVRSLCFGMPVLYPMALAMAGELAIYGWLSGFLCNANKCYCLAKLYGCLAVAMLCGRIVWAVLMALLCGVSGNELSYKMLFTLGIVNTLPGIVLQLIIVPVATLALRRAKFGNAPY